MGSSSFGGDGNSANLVDAGHSGDLLTLGYWRARDNISPLTYYFGKACCTAGGGRLGGIALW